MTLFSRFLSRLSGKPDEPLSYEKARELARHEDPEVRRALAARQDLRPEILYFLADDPHPDVRREIANNHATPPQADLMLAKDENDEVRGSLAQKIARLAPELSADERDRLRRTTYSTLALLARDQIPRVRQILAEALKDVAHAPPDVIRRLAHDTELVVAGPVLQYSPVLTDEDLLEIIHSSPIPGALSAISRRQPVEVGVADALAQSDDDDAIAILLANHSAQIREETLDKLLDRAPVHPNWHGPLVARPHLSARAVSRLAQFVAEGLLQSLLARPELDDATKEAVCAEVRRRVGEAAAEMVEPRHTNDPPDPKEPDEPPVRRASRLNAAGRLNEQAILTALSENDHAFLEAALEVMAGVPAEVVAKIVFAKSAKGMAALAWQAGLTAPVATQLQISLARIDPADVLLPRHDGSYPLTVEEMAWQIEFFGEPKVD